MTEMLIRLLNSVWSYPNLAGVFSSIWEWRRWNICDKRGTGEKKGQLWSWEIAKLERSNGERGVGGWEVADWWLAVHQQCEGEDPLSTQTQHTMVTHHLIITCLFSKDMFSLLRLPSFFLLTLSTRLSFLWNSHFFLSTTNTFPSSFYPYISVFWSLVPFFFLGLLRVPASLPVYSQAPSLQ